MSKDKRRIERSTRERRPPRQAQLGYYLIYTDAEETEKNYLEGLRQALPDHLKKKIVITVKNCKTPKLVDQCVEEMRKQPQYSQGWIVFDKDEVKNFDSILVKARQNNLQAGWSNPCIEVWFGAYFGSMIQSHDQKNCQEQFKAKFRQKCKTEYKKNDKDIYKKLSTFGSEEQAVTLAKARYEEDCKKKKSPSKCNPGTTVYQLIEEIRKYVKK